MRRIRSLRPTILDDPVIGRLGGDQFRLLVGCMLVADDKGNLALDADQLAGAVFWAHRHLQVAELVDDLVAVGLLQPYTVAGARYAHIIGWSRKEPHADALSQRIDRPGDSEIPRPDTAESPQLELMSPRCEDSTNVRRTFVDRSTNVRGSIQREGKGREGKGSLSREREGAADPLDSSRPARRSTRTRTSDPLPWQPGEMLEVLEASAGDRFARTPLSRGLVIALGRAIREMAEAGYALDDVRVAGEFIRSWRTQVQYGPGWAATTGPGGLFELLGRAKAWAARGRPDLGGARASPGSAPSVGPDPRDIANLAATEAEYRASGKPLPWANDPRRLAMTRDALGNPLEPLVGGAS